MREHVQRVPGDSGCSTSKLAPHIVNDVVRSAGRPLDEANRRFMEARFGTDFGDVRVHDDTTARASLDAVNARAYAVGSHIVLGDARAMRPSDRRTLAHELTHVIQQRGAGARQALTIGDGNDSAEREAERVAHDVLGSEGGDIRPTFSASPAGQAVQRQPKDRQDPQGPYDKMLVDNARRRLALLKQYLSEREARRARSARVSAEITELGEKRARMDTEGSNPFGDEERRAIEARRMGALNTRPLSTNVTDKQITITVRLQVRFENEKLASKFGELKSSIQSGVEKGWNQDLKTGVFGGRKLVVIPEVTQVAASAKRDQSAWLITVRSSDTAKVTYPGCNLDQPEPGAPTSVTDSACDGGVMSIPPAHTARPDIIGHELMHLFGFLDRYIEITTPGPDKKMHTKLGRTRETGGRLDPLASEQGTVLVEDLSMLFDNLGIYEAEKTRDLDVLAQLEKQGMTVNAVMAEIARQEAIIKAGGDPDGPQPKKSFIKNIVDSVDEI